jgi:putative hydrolase of the HAD superfamily
MPRENKAVVVADADNTLWDTDAVFQNAQLLLLVRVESAVGRTCTEVDRLAFIRRYDQALAQAHHLHLRYPPQLLVRATEAGLAGISEHVAAENVIARDPATGSGLLDHARIDSIVSAYLLALAQIPDLLPGVSEGLCLARDAGMELYVMTEGRIEKQRHFLEVHRLQQFFDGVWEMTKEHAQFARVRTRFKDRRVMVIGDQPDRDTVPAKAAGCTGILVPSRFKPSWHATGEPDYVAKDFLDAVHWCLRADCREAVNA